jgi:zinc finger-containing ubiquitin peptidase 1
MDSFSCPFCNFSDQDSYFLLQHVELIHPENGESPFIATEAIENEGRSSSSSHQINEEEAAHQQKQTLPSSSSSADSPATYIECPYNCGELVASAELTSHTDFHLAENMAFEEETLVGSLQFSTGACNDKQAVKDITTHFSTDIPKALRRDDLLGSPTSRRSSLKELLFGGPPRRTPTKVSGGGTKRLGVGSTPVLRVNC